MGAGIVYIIGDDDVRNKTNLWTQDCKRRKRRCSKNCHGDVVEMNNEYERTGKIVVVVVSDSGETSSGVVDLTFDEDIPINCYRDTLIDSIKDMI